MTSALSTDKHQTYVVTTAERLGRDPRELAATSHREVARSLEGADVAFDVVGQLDASYVAFVQKFFTRLFEAGAFERSTARMGYDPARSRYLFESYASGRCPVCLALTKGNICETCGSPNDAAQLIPVGERDQNESRELITWVLPLERHRDRLEAFYRDRWADLRHSLRQLLRRLLRRELPEFPITFPSQWGIPVDQPGTEGLVLNVWAEMYPGHLYWLSQPHGGQLPQGERCYVQFLGFDNSFFYAVAHPCLAFAAQDAGLDAVLPGYLYTNEFYQYEHFKFSTSQRHLVWARDLLARYEASPVRFYLCYSNPEHQQTNFSEPDMTTLTQKYLSEPLGHVVRRCNERLTGFVPDGELSGGWSRVLEASRECFEEAYSPEGFSLRGAAQALVQHLDLLAERAETLSPDDREEATGVLTALASLRILVAPIMPQLAQELAAAFDTEVGPWEEALHPPLSPYQLIDPGIADLWRRSAATAVGRIPSLGPR